MYNYSYNYTTSTADVAGVAGVLAGIGVGTWVISMIMLVLSIVAQWKIFVKAGEEGWKAIIPVYNLITLYKIAGMNPWMVLLTLVPVANIVVAILLANNLSKAFGKGTGFTVGLIFLSFIFYLILAFDSSEYVGTKA